MGDWLEHKQSLANQPGTNLRHIRDREQSRRNRLLRPASFKVGDLVLVHHSRLPSWPRNCLQDPHFGPYRIIRIDGSRIHVRCSPRLGGELLCAPKQLRHYHSPDDLSWDEWRLSDSEIVCIDLENAASPEEADKLEEMTADEMAVDGYYMVAGIARHEYKQGWKFLTLWDGYGLSEATWEPMSAFIQPDGSINPIFRTYLVENNEGQLLTRAKLIFLCQSVPCRPMPMVSSVSQVAAYHDCSHPASVCLVDHVLHGYCPNVMTLESQRRTVAYYTRGE